MPSQTLITASLCSLSAAAAGGPADPRAVREHGRRPQPDAAPASVAISTAFRDAGSLRLSNWCAAAADGRIACKQMLMLPMYIPQNA